ncbi:hypothetical protein Phum_PHUM004570 [Pediculus humanus corporis]|uniref:Uncharacterized protein n=1 Tax=Pediculus humanus subsp. corporis TaxID=121224 RepID=E0V969_PEDHC|nr:uncharacterized protein Phum_PHUM004570 [Pediculus humanus corporis]EEB09925.1 hypothetical protein Phum_PHUM004570 [Pediculus humanus corporis]
MITKKKFNFIRCEELVEPQLSALAKICVYCIIAVVQSTSKDQSNKKRNRKDVDCDDNDSYYPAPKHMKLNNEEPSVGFGTNSCFSPSRQPSMAPALQSACNELFNAFMLISNRNGEISQQTHFVYKFLEMLVKCGREKSRLVLQGQPLHNLVQTNPTY